MKVKQMTSVGNTYISDTQTFPQKKFLSQVYFLLVNYFTPSFNRSHQEADICEQKNSSQFHSINFERVFNL